MADQQSRGVKEQGKQDPGDPARRQGARGQQGGDPTGDTGGTTVGGERGGNGGRRGGAKGGNTGGRADEDELGENA